MGRPKRAAAAAAEKAIKGDEPAPTKGSKKVKSGLAVGDDLPSFELQTDTEATLSSTEMVRARLVCPPPCPCPTAFAAHDTVDLHSSKMLRMCLVPPHRPRGTRWLERS